MGYGDIIKRAWKITWRYRALWVLGLFAGVTGSSSGGGSGGNNFNSNSNSGSGSGSNPFSDLPDPSWWSDQIVRILPVVIAVVVLLVVLGFVTWVLRIAARGGLVQAVNAIEESQTFTLGAAWNAGFGAFWKLLGLSILLSLPLTLVALGLALAAIIPFALPLLRGDTPNPAAFAPLCGAFIIGVPVLMVGGIILGIMHELAMRSIMLDGIGVFEAAGNAWRSFRSRIKDTLIIWFINLGLNIAAGIVIAIPIVIIVIVAVIPIVLSATTGSYGTLITVATVGIILLTILTMFFTAVWGTFTSALWTIFYRRFTGREVVAPLMPVAPDAPLPPAVPAAPVPPAVPDAPQPPAAPAAPEGATL
jgi:hypothetical protein